MARKGIGRPTIVTARFRRVGPFTSVEINATIPPISIDSSVTPWCWAAAKAGNARPGGALIHNGWASCEKAVLERNRHADAEGHLERADQAGAAGV